jgi:citronellol/citronellal dehydrogenase
MDLSGKVAIVTGSSRGVGKGIALEMARAGANVVVAARSEQETDPKLPGTIYSTAEEIARETGRKALALRVDVTNDDDVRAMVEKTTSELGKVDILVNNAGVMFPGPFVETPLKRWDLLYRVNMRAGLSCAQAALPGMIERGGGTIIFISSVAADHKGAFNISYSVTKQADRKIAEGLAEEFKSRGIKVFSLSPEGLILSPGVLYHRTDEMMPGQDIEDPAEMGQAAVLLASGAIDERSGEHFYSRALLRELAKTPAGGA